jgi:hypothetical protein
VSAFILCYESDGSPVGALYFFIAYSPSVNVNRANVSLALLPIFTQNSMSIRCSRFLSLTSPPNMQAAPIRGLQLWKLFWIYSEDMYCVSNCHNVAKHSEFYVGQLRFNMTSTGKQCFRNNFTMVLLMLTVCRVLRKRLNCPSYGFKCKRFRNTRHTVTFEIPLQSSFWNALHYQWNLHCSW